MSDLDRIREDLRHSLPALASALGIQRGDGGRYWCPFCQPDPSKHKTPDLYLSESKGCKCHKCGWKGSPLDLIMEVKACAFPKALEYAEQVLGGAAIGGGASRRAPKPTRSKTIYAAKELAFEAVGRQLKRQFNKPWELVAHWDYCGADGKTVAIVTRWQDGDKKQYRPVSRFGGGWIIGKPKNGYPLYNLPEIIKNARRPVIVTEGEKAADAGCFFGLVCTTTAHGADGISTTDLSQIKNRTIILLPDNDEAGVGYVTKLAVAVNGSANCYVVKLPGLPPKGDLYDYAKIHGKDTLSALRKEVYNQSGVWI